MHRKSPPLGRQEGMPLILSIHSRVWAEQRTGPVCWSPDIWEKTQFYFKCPKGLFTLTYLFQPIAQLDRRWTRAVLSCRLVIASLQPSGRPCSRPSINPARKPLKPHVSSNLDSCGISQIRTECGCWDQGGLLPEAWGISQNAPPPWTFL